MGADRHRFSLPLGVAACTIAMLALDLTWLGAVARPFYDAQLGALRRPDVYLPAALLFYALYLAAVVGWAAGGASSRRHALQRGAGLGLLAYGTYDLTNWAVLRDWPPLLVPVDVAWGVLLTAVVSAAGHAAMFKAGRT